MRRSGVRAPSAPPKDSGAIVEIALLLSRALLTRRSAKPSYCPTRRSVESSFTDTLADTFARPPRVRLSLDVSCQRTRAAAKSQATPPRSCNPARLPRSLFERQTRVTGSFIASRYTHILLVRQSPDNGYFAD